MEHYNSMAVSYDIGHSQLFYVDLLKLELKTIEALNPTTILDVGCGTGQLMEKLQKKYNVVGVDSSTKMLNIANGKGLKTFHGNAENLCWLADNSFDVVCCFKALPHIKNKRKALQEFANVSRKYVVFSYYNKHSLMRLWRFLLPKPVLTKYDSLNDIEAILPKELQIIKVIGYIVFSPSNVLYFRKLENVMSDTIKQFFGSHIIVVCEKVKK